MSDEGVVVLGIPIPSSSVFLGIVAVHVAAGLAWCPTRPAPTCSTRALEGYQVAGALRFPIAAHLVSSRK